MNSELFWRRKTVQLYRKNKELKDELTNWKHEALWWKGVAFLQLRIAQDHLDGWEWCQNELDNCRKEYNRLLARKNWGEDGED